MSEIGAIYNDDGKRVARYVMPEGKGMCVFCDIVAGREKAQIVEDWLHTLVFHQINPVVPGHLLVIPKRHVQDFTTSPLTSGSVMVRAAEFAKEAGGQYNLITSAGPDATQTVMHMHVHLVPRRRDDGLTLPWTGQQV